MRIAAAASIMILALTGISALGQADAQGKLQVLLQPEQTGIVGRYYRSGVAVRGGSSPYFWQVTKGDIPPGLKLQPHSGRILGVPTTPGEYHFTVVVSDASIPHLQVQRDFTIRVIAGLTVDWKEPPRVQGNSIFGSAVVTNQTPGNLDLTVIIVAVNKIGRATTLGYQHFTLPPETTSTIIPFEASPGAGAYFVRVDAVAHHPGKKYNYRASKQTATLLQVGAF